VLEIGMNTLEHTAQKEKPQTRKVEKEKKKDVLTPHIKRIINVS